jgi:hypothetical protein
MKALGIAFLVAASAAAGAALATYALKKRDDIDRYDFEFDEDDDFLEDDDFTDSSELAAMDGGIDIEPQIDPEVE